MNKLHLFLSCLISIIVVSVASATWVPLTDEVPLSELPNGILIVGDKEFSEFDLFGFAVGGAIAPDMDSVFVQGGQDDVTNDYGLRFLLALDAGSGQIVNANLSFKVSILPDYERYFINDVRVLVTGVSATDTGVVNLGETVWDAPLPAGNLLASLSCSIQESGAVLMDYAEFDSVKEIWVRKDLSVSGGTGLTGAAHLSEFFQFYSQIPEPATIALLGLGALALLPRRRK